MAYGLALQNKGVETADLLVVCVSLVNKIVCVCNTGQDTIPS